MQYIMEQHNLDNHKTGWKPAFQHLATLAFSSIQYGGYKVDLNWSAENTKAAGNIQGLVFSYTLLSWSTNTLYQCIKHITTIGWHDCCCMAQHLILQYVMYTNAIWATNLFMC